MPVKKKPVKKKAPAKKNVKAIKAPTQSNGEVSMSVRKIDNGWIVREEKLVRGRYVATEHFTTTKPVFAITK